MKKNKFTTPKLIPLDMSKSKKNSHPDINSKDSYLILHDGQYFAGSFSKTWFGWTFNGWYGTSLQFDAPNTNASCWQQIWKIDGPKPKKVKFPEEKCTVKGCKGTLKPLKTCYGDPEGIRGDSKCRKCGTLYGCSKSSLFAISKEKYEELKEDDW